MTAALVECEFHGEHGRIDERLGQLEKREDQQDAKLSDLEKASSGIREEIAGMRGELRGALWASKLGGAVVGSLIALVGSGALGLLLYLLERK